MKIVLSLLERCLVKFLSFKIPLLDLSLLFLLNYCFLQFFFVRLAKIIDIQTQEVQGLCITKWIFPFTGWTDVEILDDYIVNYDVDNYVLKDERKKNRTDS